MDGGWSAWTLGSCTVTCGGGARSNTRTCDNPAPQMEELNVLEVPVKANHATQMHVLVKILDSKLKFVLELSKSANLELFCTAELVLGFLTLTTQFSLK